MELTKKEILDQMQAFQLQWAKDHPPSCEEEQTKAELAKRQAAQFTVLFGPFVAGDYQIGNLITFRPRNAAGTALTVATGQVIWSYGPGRTPVSQTVHPLLYLVDADIGVPILVPATDIIPPEQSWGELL